MEFIFNGKSNRDFNLKINKSNHISKPSKKVEFINVPGRNGDIAIDEGCSENLIVEIICKLDTRKTKDIVSMSNSIGNWLQGPTGYRKLKFSDGIEFDAVCVNQIDISKVVKEFNEVKVNFSCTKSTGSIEGEYRININKFTTLYNSGVITKPYLKILGTGDITININNQTLVLKSIENEIEIDSEIMNAYKEVDGKATLQNNKMYSEFPIFEEGRNNITWEGNVSSIEIVPRWVVL